MADDLYLNQFLDALKFYDRIHKKKHFTAEVIANYKRYILEGINELDDEYDRARSVITELANKQIELILNQGLPVAKKCHSASTVIHRFWNSPPYIEMSKAMPIEVTIGNVFYKGRNVYEVSRQRLKKIYSEGFQPDKTIDVHVWLTMHDMTVIDPSILSTIAGWGEETGAYSDSNILTWRSGDASDFRFEPLLVDNNFHNIVDTPI